ncbi:TfoX/Sxy family protein [Elioraea sp.]|uniref:TfoX/Sxy family protein n=1 Tax=Elioraea sp. TaxID=2185103 RepID=UPI003F72F4A9
MTWTADDQAAADLAREVLGTLGAIEIRPMFGGAGVYLHGVIFAIILGGEIHLKADRETARELEAAGARQLEWTSPRTGQRIRMEYWTLPDSALDNADAVRVWVGKAIAGAHRPPARKRSFPTREGTGDPEVEPG